METLTDGTTLAGERWTLGWEPADDGRIRVEVSLSAVDGTQHVGGALAPRQLPDDRRIEATTHEPDSGSCVYLVRLSPDVAHVVLTLSDGSRELPEVVGAALVPDLRFAALVHDRALHVVTAGLHDVTGAPVPHVVEGD